MSKLERIAAFITVVEANSFVDAAKQLGVSTAAVSRQISRLESDLNAELLKRTTRKLSLTDIGMQYYQSCKEALGALTQAEHAIGNKQDATGVLKITSSRYFALQYLIPHLPKYLAQNPKVRVKLELAERFPDLGKENIDVLYGVSMEGPAALVRKRVTSTRYVLCAAPSYLQQFGIPQTPMDLVKHRYITHSMRQPINVISFKDNKEIYVNPYLWLNDSSAMCDCAIAGMGIIKLHEYIVAQALREGLLIEFLADYQEPEIPIYVYYQQSKYLQPKIRTFIDFYSQDIVTY